MDTPDRETDPPSGPAGSLPSDQPAPIGPDGLPLWGEGSLASIGKRAVGRIIDNLMFGLPFFVLATSRGWVPVSSAVDIAHIPWWVPVVPVAAQALYETIAIATLGRTVGKWVAGTRVELGDGRLPTWHQAALRALVPMAAALVPFLPGLLTLVVFLVAVTNPLRQGVHDRAAGTIVVNATHTPEVSLP